MENKRYKELKGVEINIQELQSNVSSQWIEFLFVAAAAIILLFISPLLIVVVLFLGFYSWMMSIKHSSSSDIWQTINTNADHSISWRYLAKDKLIESVQSTLNEIPVVVYNTEPFHPFFNGYFTDIKIERKDGVFVQKINLDETGNEILSLPLCYFCFKTLKAEEILDLKGYELVVKGNVNDFAINGFNAENEINIRIQK